MDRQVIGHNGYMLRSIRDHIVTYRVYPDVRTTCYVTGVYTKLILSNHKIKALLKIKMVGKIK